MVVLWYKEVRELSFSPTCPTQEQWDQFICGIAGPDVHLLVEHLAVCPYCRFGVAERRREFDALSDAAPATRASVIQLFPLTIEPTIGVTETHLAAQGATPPKPVQSLTLTSADNRLLLRVVRDAHTADVWIYLLSDDPMLCQNVLVRPFLQDHEYLTDHSGRVNLGAIEWPAAEKQKAEVQVPTALFSLQPQGTEVAERTGTILSSSHGDQIRVRFSGEAKQCRLEIELLAPEGRVAGAPFRVAVRDVASGQIRMVRSESSTRARVDGLVAPQSIEIFLFR